MKYTLPTDSAERKDVPLVGGVIRYFPAALAGVARHSLAGNRKHNGDAPLHHARGKSGDHEECAARHLLDLQDLRAAFDRTVNVSNSPAGEYDRVTAAMLAEVDALAWRALALSQELHETYGGAPLAPGARLPEPPVVLIDYSYECPREPVDGNRLCRATSPDGDETCLQNTLHTGAHVGTYTNWPSLPDLPDAIRGPAGADWREPVPLPPPDQRGCPEGYYRATWPKVTKVPGHDYPAVWISKDGTNWYANPDSHEDEVKGKALLKPFKSEAQARAGYWEWKDLQTALSG
jgi:hypothetical protein